MISRCALAWRTYEYHSSSKDQYVPFTIRVYEQIERDGLVAYPVEIDDNGVIRTIHLWSGDSLDALEASLNATRKVIFRLHEYCSVRSSGVPSNPML